MSPGVDWSWKLREALERVKTRYDHIGRKTGDSFLAVIYPPEAEAAVLKEWKTLARHSRSRVRRPHRRRSGGHVGGH